MSRTTEEVGSRVVGGVAVGTGGVIGPGLKPRAMAGMELGQGSAV